MTDPDEANIACGLVSGSTTAWCALYDRHAEGVWRLVARLMGPSASEVPDVVQETFLAAARSAHGYDATRGTLWGWLSGIARRHVALHYRNAARRHKLYSADGRPAIERERIIAWLEGRTAEPPEEVARTETAELVRSALIEMPDEYALLLIRRYFDDESIDRLAQSAGATPTAIRSQLARARRAFRDLFVTVTAPASRVDHNSDAGCESGGCRGGGPPGSLIENCYSSPVPTGDLTHE